jgi:hypothetical protein
MVEVAKYFLGTGTMMHDVDKEGKTLTLRKMQPGVFDE